MVGNRTFKAANDGTVSNQKGPIPTPFDNKYHSNSARIIMLYNGAVNTTTLHRRQNSSPMDMDSVMRAPLVPTNPQPAAHRRGLSIDHARHSQDFHQFNTQNCGKVSTNNNGPSQQQTLRATQMPASSRPGHNNNNGEQFPGHIHPHFHAAPYVPSPSNELRDPAMGSSMDQSFHFAESGRIDPLMMPAGPAGNVVQHGGSQANNAISQLVDEMSKLPTHNIKQLFEELGLRYEIGNVQGGNEPNGMMIDDFNRVNGDNTRTNGTKHSSLAMKRGISWPEPLRTDTSFALDRSIPSPPNSAPLRCEATFEAVHFPPSSFLSAANSQRGLIAVEKGRSSCTYSPMSNRSALSSFQSSPELGPVSLFGTSSNADEYPSSPCDIQLFPSTESAASKRKGSNAKKGSNARSVSDEETNFNPNDFLIESSITEEEINAHIQGPEENGKYICLYENCKNAPFGRKENIRAHVQTHLDDRRYKCDACNNKFVRPNDLKRHWQIHVNKRDFKCFCGAAFNRHDALKRHRERSEWCESGGTRGSPDSPKKDEKKRGRPKKIAPTESQERRERKAQIRREIRKKQEASVASSVASSQPSPPSFFDFADEPTAPTDASGLSPAHIMLSPPASPQRSIDELLSPATAHDNHFSRQSLSPPPTRDSMISFGTAENRTIDAFLLQDPEPTLGLTGSSSIGNSSRQGSPPSLDLMSSSPPSNFLEFDFDSVPFCSNPGTSDASDKTMTEFDQMYRWFSEQDDNQAMSGIDPSQMHITPTMDDPNDPMPW